MKTLSFFLAAALLVVFLGCQEADPVAPIVATSASADVQKGLSITEIIDLPDGQTAVVSAQVKYGFANASLNKKLPVATYKAFDLSLEVEGKVTLGEKALLKKPSIAAPITWKFAGQSVDRVYIAEAIWLEKVYVLKGAEEGILLHIQFKVGEMSIEYAEMHTSAGALD